MAYKVKFDIKAIRMLGKIDKTQAERIYSWVMSKIDGCVNPRAFGKPVSDPNVGNWRYRIGAYRVVCEIQDNVCTVLVVRVGHRRKVYD